jgi:hypothetical protein
MALSKSFACNEHNPIDKISIIPSSFFSFVLDKELLCHIASN